MKLIIIIIFFILFQYCNAQSGGGTLPTKEELLVLVKQNREKDTIKVIMLVCDTNTGPVSTMGFFSTARQAENDNRIPYWIYGYSVREKHNTDEGKIDPYSAYGYVSEDYWVHVKYIDEYKKDFPKNIIIWMAK